MKVLIACEFSGIVREEFRKLGHEAWSCDLLPTEIPGNHYQGDIFEFLDKDMSWDLMIAHPPCTHLAVSGACWFPNKIEEQKEALEFVRRLMNFDIPKIAIENPVSIISTRIRKPDQIIQPYWFGDPYPKKTCLWLKNLPNLLPTKMVEPEYYISKHKRNKSGVSKSSFLYAMGSKHGKQRSVTPKGFAQAMATQWGTIENPLSKNYKER